jgi:ribonuclease HI
MPVRRWGEIVSDAFWLPVRFKGKKVFAECDEAGGLRVRDGKIAIVYNLGAAKAYSTYPDRVEAVAGAVPRAGQAAAPAPSGAGRAPRKTAGSRGGGKSNDEVLGGTPDDIEDPRHIHLWSDGACSGNPGPAGAGTVLLIDGRRREWSTWLGQGTNNIAELVAVQQGLRALERPLARTVVVHTDSQYSIGVLARGWKAKANPELIAAIRKDLEGLPRVVWHWVRGHLGVELNERCDELAREAIAARRSTDREV